MRQRLPQPPQFSSFKADADVEQGVQAMSTQRTTQAPAGAPGKPGEQALAAAPAVERVGVERGRCPAGSGGARHELMHVPGAAELRRRRALRLQRPQLLGSLKQRHARRPCRSTCPAGTAFTAPSAHSLADLADAPAGAAVAHAGEGVLLRSQPLPRSISQLAKSGCSSPHRPSAEHTADRVIGSAARRRCRSCSRSSSASSDSQPLVVAVAVGVPERVM